MENLDELHVLEVFLAASDDSFKTYNVCGKFVKDEFTFVNYDNEYEKSYPFDIYYYRGSKPFAKRIYVSKSYSLYNKLSNDIVAIVDFLGQADTVEY